MPVLSTTLPEIIVSDAATTEMVSRSVGAGKLRKLASRLYTPNLPMHQKRSSNAISGISSADLHREH